MKKLKILFPAGSFYPAQNGGPDNTVYWITKALARRGHEPTVVTTDWGLPLVTPRGRWLETDFGKVIYTRDLIHHYLALPMVSQTLRKLREADIVHLSMITYPGSLMVALLNSWFVGRPMLWSSRGDLDPPMLQRSRKRKAFFLWAINKLVDKNRLWFHSTCDAETRYIRNNFGEDTKVIQIPNYMELPERIEAPKEKYFMYIGRIDPKKAIENLLEALGASEAFRHSEFILKVVGDHYNDYGRALVRQTEKLGLEHKVRFLGHRDGREKEELLAGAWFTFMPSHTENFGIVVMEGLAQGTPAVASTGTPWEVLEEAEAGFWVDNDPSSLREVVDRILNIPSERMLTLNDNALRLARERFSIHANVEEWEQAYQRILT